MEFMNCRNCGKEINGEYKVCPYCGKKIESENSIIQKIKYFKYFKLLIITFALSLLAFVIALLIAKNINQKKLPVKVDISMTSYYGSINYILYELGLDFDLVTMGANCYTGVQRNEFKTEKYGILHTEFRYCKSNYTLIFRVYNDEKDQKLREPKPGEVPIFDEYGKRNTSTIGYFLKNN